MRNYYTINEEQHKANIADNIVLREAELYAYDLNIENYTRLLADLTDQEWPEYLLEYKGKSADQIPDEFDAICNELNYRDRIAALLKTEKAEREKSRRIYEVLIGQLEQNERSQLINAADVRRKQKI